MSTLTYINAAEFIETLKKQGLVIVSAREHEAGLEIKRQQLLKKKSLSLKEISESQLLGKKTKKCLNDWIVSGKIHNDEWYRESKGHQRIMVLTMAIKRLRNEN